MITALVTGRLAGRSRTQLEVRSQREELGRHLRWAVEQSTAGNPDMSAAVAVSQLALLAEDGIGVSVEDLAELALSSRLQWPLSDYQVQES